MARTENDTWDLASSVGPTATMVAAARAVATKSDDHLIDDPFAEPLVKAVGIDFFARLAAGELDPADVDDDAVLGVQRMTDGMAVRTRYFDEFFDEAAKARIRQVVISASGLDSRAYRLPWPTGTTVFEIDQPQVIEFKTVTLADLGAVPTADRRVVAIDLRQDWPAALLRAGFDAGQRTAWIAEGLLGYLPPDAQDRLLDRITALSAAGSRLALESIPNMQQLDDDRIEQRMQSLTEAWRNYGFDLDFTDLVYLGDRNDVEKYLNTHGWETVGTATSDLFVANGLDPVQDDSDEDALANVAYVSATLK
jgi:methyltransferase (TIGR00027 family)